MRTLLNKTFLASASALSVLSLLLVAPAAVNAQETIEERTGETGFTETVEVEDSSLDRDGMNSSDMDVDSEMEMDGEMDMDSAFDEMDAEDADIESDIDYSDDDDSDIEAESYSNSPRALW